jgi:acyl transferase domain-containing protein
VQTLEGADVWLYAGEDVRDLLGAVRRYSDTNSFKAEEPEALAGGCRLAIASPNARRLALAESVLQDGKRWSGRGDVWFSPRPLAWEGGRVAFLFPGLEPAFQPGRTDFASLKVLAEGLEPPTLSWNTLAGQASAVVQTGLFLNAVLEGLGIRADHFGGHSIGEWTAAVASNLVHPEYAARLIETLDLDEIDRILPAVDFVVLNGSANAVANEISRIPGVVVSHDNCPRQSIICGAPEQVQLALDILRPLGIRGIRLPFRSGFHSPSITGSLDVFKRAIDIVPLGPPVVPVWSATLAAPLPPADAEIRNVLVRHIVEPVRFGPMISEMYEEEVQIYVQVGIGSLVGFVDETLKGQAHLAVSVAQNGQPAARQMQRALSALWVDGIESRAPIRPVAQEVLESWGLSPISGAGPSIR